MLHQALVRFLREAKAQIVIEDTWSFRQRRRDRSWAKNIHARTGRCCSTLPLSLNWSYVSSDLGKAARQRDKHLAEVERKNNTHRCLSTATCFLLPLAIMSTCCNVGSDVHALIKGLAIRRVEYNSEINSEGSLPSREGSGNNASSKRRFARLTADIAFLYATSSLHQGVTGS